jgi:hypothetical protein
MPGRDLEEEQRYIDHAYRCLERMRARSEELLASMKGADPDLEWALARRVRALANNPRALCFGRIDGEQEATWYIGRRPCRRRRSRPGRRRVAGTDRPAVLPGQLEGPDGSRPAKAVRGGWPRPAVRW